MSVYKRLSLVLVLVFLVLQTQTYGQVEIQVEVSSGQSASSDKSYLLDDGLRIIQGGFVGLVDLQGVVSGVKRELLMEIKKNAVLRTKPSLINDLSQATTVSSLRDVYNKCVNVLGGEDKNSRLIYAMMRGMTKSLADPHTSFFSPGEAQKFLESLRGTSLKGGIGIIFGVDEKSKFAVVHEVIENSPALRGGLLAKDLIIAVDGVSTKGMDVDKISSSIRGEADSPVRLTIVRRGGQPFDVTFVRKPVSVGSVRSSVMDDIGYIKLRYFGEDTNREIDACFAKFDAANVKAYVLDMRGNSGGYVSTAIHTVSKFLPQGKIVVSFTGRTYPTEIHVTNGSRARDLPVVVLINEYSASASEIVAGALQDHGYKVVGIKSYGKGSMQEMKWLVDGSMIKITRARWFTPLHHPVDGVGITPNIKVEQDENSEEDVQLERALQEASR